jgi:hypothetical protein
MKASKEYSTLQLRQRLVAAGVDPEKFDISAHVDSKLSQRENFINLTQMTGTSKRKDYSGHSGIKRELQSTLKGEFYQIGKSRKEVDEKRKAQLPGKRRSASGKTYTERRKNRSDRPGWRV